MSQVSKVGIRAGKLAQAQLKAVLPLLAEADIEAQPVVVKSGSDGRELHQALSKGEIDIALDHLKDIPAREVDGVAIAAYLKRGDPRDALLSRGPSWVEMPAGAKIGAGSIRRIAQLRSHRPDLDYHPIVGDSDARIAKLKAGEYDAIVLGVDGLKRMPIRGKELHIEALTFDVLMPAPGQGVLILQTRSDDRARMRTLAALNDSTTECEARAERAFLATFGGGCGMPAAAYGSLDQLLTVEGLVASASGAEVLRDQVTGHPNAPEYLGARLADVLLYRGAKRLLIPERREPTDDGG